MPTYNGAAYLCAALRSIVAQGDTAIEVIAVDDGSTDTTVPILKSFEARLPLTVVRRRHVGNWVASTNYGLSIAKGDYISFLHQDDLWMHDRLRVLKPVVAKNPLATMVLHPSWFIDTGGTRVGLWQCPLRGYGHDLDQDAVIERLLVQNFIAIPAPLFSRQAALGAGALDEDLWYTADWDLWLRLAAAGPTIYIPRALAAFRLHHESQTMRRSTHHADFRRQLEVVLSRHLTSRRPVRRSVRVAAYLSLKVNVMLAARARGERPALPPLLFEFLMLGPAGWYRYTRDSRIRERLMARIRIGLADRPTNL
jgi:glycosyltransferase involved in cell wall biosynthesis